MFSPDEVQEMAAQAPRSDVDTPSPAGPGGRKLKLGIALAVLLVAVGYFAFTAFQSATVYYLTVGEVLAREPTGDTVRVNGNLVQGSFERAGGSTLARFRLTGDTRTLEVEYNGLVPDLFFNEHSEIVAEGVYGDDGTFDARNILVKCPSKYVAETEQRGGRSP